jgi:hypothetical protein
MRRALLIVAVPALTVCAIAAGCGASSTTQPDATRHAPHTTPITPSSITGRNSPTTTLEEFSKVKDGMTLAQVTTIIGSPGTVDRSSHNNHTESRVWRGRPETGGFAMIVFRDGIVFGKTQVDLS